MYDRIASNKRRTILLMIVFVALVLLIGYVFGEWFGWGLGGLLFSIVLVTVMLIGSWWFSDRIVLGVSRARPVDRQIEPYLVNTIEGLSIAAGLPLPDAYVIDDPAPNAFATGRDPEHSAIAVTTGLMEKLDRLELEGVVAHELAHIKNRDTLVQTIAAVLGGSVTLMSEWMVRSIFFRGGRKSGGAIVGIVGIALAILAPIFAILIQMAVSRQREFLADANGALLTRYPDGLANALRKISADTNRLSVANKATASLYIYNPLKDYRGGMNALFNTHPPVEERIRRLEAM
jgi:heat shock protein HtpX